MSFKIRLDGQTYDADIVARRPNLAIRIGSRVHVVEVVCDGRDGEKTLVIDGQPVSFTRGASSEGVFVRLKGQTFDGSVHDPARDSGGSGGSDTLRAPMPGTVVTVHRKPGDAVSRGETIVTIESMKLQMALNSPRDGVIAEITAAAGSGFDKDAVLVRLETLIKDE